MAESEELAEKAREAFLDDEFELAVDFYSQAISLNPQNADLFAERAQANIKLTYFTEAVGDANKAIELDRSMAKAYLRKGIACLKLEEYHTAKRALEIGVSFAKGDSRFRKLITECESCIEEENMILYKSLRPNEQACATTSSVKTLMEFEKRCKLPNQNDPSLKPKYRHEFYQKPDEVVLTIFAKGIPARNVVIQFGEQTLSVSIRVAEQETYHFQPRLFGKIIQDKCSYQVLSTKVEIRLVKADTIHWESLEYSSNITPQNIAPSGVSNRPVYPTSKPRPKNWDKLEAQVKKEEQEEKLEGGAALDEMLRRMYLEADEDSRRAMTKSLVDSKGRVMSMDWKQVGYKCSP